ncbi:MAG: hypothetical protein M1826_006175 [Phylliscum demangeonii]|nr:MAG: hypothetical protein M1826_006175 [Phylliscum demangeonii]
MDTVRAAAHVTDAGANAIASSIDPVTGAKEFTYADVAAHTTKEDALVVIHDVVYDVSSFVDEHPGGEEVLLDVAGQDATEAFEDVGHSDEARSVLQGLEVGKLKRVADRQAGDPTPKMPPAKTAHSSTAAGDMSSEGLLSGWVLYALVLVGGLLAFVAWRLLGSGGASTKV